MISNLRKYLKNKFIKTGETTLASCKLQVEP